LRFAFEAELAIPLWDFCDTWQMFSPDHITGRFSCSDVAIRTRGGVRMGVETILLIVILTFVAGFVLDRLAMRRPIPTPKSRRRNCDCNFTNAREQRVGRLVTTHPRAS
jgi:hypothetical protein